MMTTVPPPETTPPPTDRSESSSSALRPIALAPVVVTPHHNKTSSDENQRQDEQDDKLQQVRNCLNVLTRNMEKALMNGSNSSINSTDHPRDNDENRTTTSSLLLQKAQEQEEAGCHILPELVALQNAVYMIQQHYQLAKQEALDTLQDLRDMRDVAQNYETRAKTAETRVLELEHQNQLLQEKNAKLQLERRILKHAYKEKIERNRVQETAILHKYVETSIQHHEDCLKQNNRSRTNTASTHCDDDDDDDDEFEDLSNTSSQARHNSTASQQPKKGGSGGVGLLMGAAKPAAATNIEPNTSTASSSSNSEEEVRLQLTAESFDSSTPKQQFGLDALQRPSAAAAVAAVAAASEEGQSHTTTTTCSSPPASIVELNLHHFDSNNTAHLVQSPMDGGVSSDDNASCWDEKHCDPNVLRSLAIPMDHQ